MRVFYHQGPGEEHMAKLNTKGKGLPQNVRRKEPSPSRRDEHEDLGLHTAADGGPGTFSWRRQGHLRQQNGWHHAWGGHLLGNQSGVMGGGKALTQDGGAMSGQNGEPSELAGALPKVLSGFQ